MIPVTVRPLPTQNRRLRKMEGEGAAQAGLWTMVVPFSATSRPINGNSKVLSCGRSGPSSSLSRSSHVRRRRGRFFTGPHRAHFSCCESNVFINVGRKEAPVFLLFSGVHHTVCDETRWHCGAMSVRHGYAVIVRTGYAIMP